MPGLRHAHTLQQLKSFNEYSPPGEYLIKTVIAKQQRQQKKNPKEEILTITKEVIVSIVVVVVVCEHGVSPALKSRSLSPENYIIASSSFFRHVHSIISLPCSDLFSPSNCAVLFVIRPEELICT